MAAVNEVAGCQCRRGSKPQLRSAIAHGSVVAKARNHGSAGSAAELAVTSDNAQHGGGDDGRLRLVVHPRRHGGQEVLTAQRRDGPRHRQQPHHRACSVSREQDLGDCGVCSVCLPRGPRKSRTAASAQSREGTFVLSQPAEHGRAFGQS
jgi:hypothetical protein